MIYIQCEHSIENIRVVWHIERQMSTYKVVSPIAHCIACNSNLYEAEKNAKAAIALVMIDISRRLKNAEFKEESKK
jgi:hypothetical protein